MQTQIQIYQYFIVLHPDKFYVFNFNIILPSKLQKKTSVTYSFKDIYTPNETPPLVASTLLLINFIICGATRTIQQLK